VDDWVLFGTAHAIALNPRGNWIVRTHNLDLFTPIPQRLKLFVSLMDEEKWEDSPPKLMDNVQNSQFLLAVSIAQNKEKSSKIANLLGSSTGRKINKKLKKDKDKGSNSDDSNDEDSGKDVKTRARAHSTVKF
jgi:hypothetical protein